MDSGMLFKGSAPEESRGDGQEKNAEVVPRSLGGGKVSTPQTSPGIYTHMPLGGEHYMLNGHNVLVTLMTVRLHHCVQGLQ